jgi:carboxyl-terminal processing protease
MPDIYIAMVADKKLEYYNQLINKGLVYQFAFDYTDKNRKNFSIYKNADDYSLRFLINNNMIREFINYASANGVNKETPGFNESMDKIKILLKAFIARNLFDDIGFYPIYLKTDNAFLKAVEEINKINYK